MKKTISLLLALVMLVSLAVPAFAVDEPTEIGPNGNNEIFILNEGNYIINEDCEVKTIMSIDDNFTLTIAKGVTVKVTKTLYNMGSINVLGTLIITDAATADNYGTINVLGTLIIDAATADNYGTINVPGTLIITDAAKAESSGTIDVLGTLSITDEAYAENSGTVRVYGCTGGKLEGTIDNVGSGTVTTYDEHYYVDGKCFACGYECTQKAISSEGGTASTISEGNVWIVAAVGAAAVVAIAAVVIAKKKKKK